MKKAVLFVTFNRFDYVQKTFEQIKLAKPPRLYLASDGPREGVADEKEKIEQIRKWLLDNVDWECDVKTRFLEKNSGGCAYGVSGAISWLFENEQDGIILEDDCVPNQSFFLYCEELLDKYKDNKDIWHISGTCPYSCLDIKDSYYFVKNMSCWGWASWADRWKNFTLDLTGYNCNNIKKISNNSGVREIWLKQLQYIQSNMGFTWDFQWFLIIVANNGLCIEPAKNLITNIGLFGEHAYGESSNSLYKESYNLDKIKHPNKIRINKKAMKKYVGLFDIKPFYNNFFERVFSVKNKDKYKVITILGIRIKIKRSS